LTLLLSDICSWQQLLQLSLLQNNSCYLLHAAMLTLLLNNYWYRYNLLQTLFLTLLPSKHLLLTADAASGTAAE
jgi:hypothetical protein